jgi:hypothetical protein
MADEEWEKDFREKMQVPARKRKLAKPKMDEALKRTQLSPDAPAPRTAALIESQGMEPTEMALCAWEARIKGMPIVDVAHELGVSIVAAKQLIRDAHAAIMEDLRENLDLNRQLDLHRIDGLLQTYYPSAKAGDIDSAAVAIKCLQHRAKLVGLEALPDPGRSNPANVLVWIQTQLPNINKIVDALPVELPPAAPGEYGVT